MLCLYFGNANFIRVSGAITRQLSFIIISKSYHLANDKIITPMFEYQGRHLLQQKSILFPKIVNDLRH